MFKILAIGNSFSTDATRYLHQIAESAGVESKILNLHFSGCSLQKHVQMLDAGAESYAYILNGEHIDEKHIGLEDALKEDDWQFVTMQQTSRTIGLPDTYFPYIEKISDLVKELCPNAKQIIHQTWAYEKPCAKPAFENFGNDQSIMYGSAVAAYKRAAEKLGGLPIIRSGEMIQQIRKDPLFDIDNSKYRITRDNYHMNIPYGRYAVGALWFETIMGGDIYKAPYIPEEADQYIINRLKAYVREFSR